MPVIKILSRGGAESSNGLVKAYKNVYSQGGEDGILAEIFRIVGTQNKWCVEFGAWDGVFLSNTCNLIRNDGWSAVMIEGNPERCDQIRQNYPGNKGVIPLCAMIGFEKGVDTIDHHLATTPIPKNFDLLSIDVDGIDWHIWESIVEYRPRIVVIEFNPTVPNDVVFIQDRDMGINEGCSAAALVELARDKNYELVAVTNGNCFFVVKEEFGKFAAAGVVDNKLSSMRNDRANYIWCTYNGKIYQTLNRLSWYGKNYDFGPESLQFLSEFWFHGQFQGRPNNARNVSAKDAPDLSTPASILRELQELRTIRPTLDVEEFNKRNKAAWSAVKELSVKHTEYLSAPPDPAPVLPPTAPPLASAEVKKGSSGNRVGKSNGECGLKAHRD
jgi:hypothetical protein